MGWLGGGNKAQKKAMKKQHQYDIARWKFNWQQMQDKYQYALDAHDVQVWNMEQKRDYQNQQATQQWQDNEKKRIFDYNNQIKAYNASLEAYETQLDYNNLAAELSSSDNTRKYNEALTGIGFQNEELLEKHGFDIRGMTQDVQGKRAAAAFKSEALKVESMAQQGKVANMGQSGRTARKNMQAALAMYSNKQAELVDSITRTDSGYALQMEQKTKSTALSQRQLRESMKSAGSQYEADAAQIALQKYSADLGAQAAIAPEPVEPPQMSLPLELPKPRNLAPEEPPSWEQYESVKPIKGAVSKPSTLGKIASVVGTVASIAKIFGLSDDRLKYNITRVGNSKQGIPIYTFKYRHEGMHGPTYQGTSAQDLLEMGRDDAVGQREKDGFYYVNYGKLDVEFKQVQLA